MQRLEQRQVAQALDYYDRAHALAPTDESVLNNRALAKELAHKVRGGGESAEADTDRRIIKGRDLMAEAMADLDAAVAASPGSRYLSYNRAALHGDRGDWAAGHRELSKFIDRMPLDVDGYAKRADAAVRAGMAGAAVHDAISAATLEYGAE